MKTKFLYFAVLFALTLLLLNACASSREPDTKDAQIITPITDTTLPVTAGTWYKPDIATTWQWQLSGDVNIQYNVDLYDIDLFDAVDKITPLHDQGKKVVCYFSAGSSENWRRDFSDFNTSDMGNPLDGWEGEKWLDITSTNVRNIMLARLDLAAAQGCDGVEPDNMDGYTNNSGFNLNANDQVEYNRYIANQARSRGLAVGLKNDTDQLNDLVDFYDFAVNEQCFQFDECEEYQVFIDQNKPVFNAEYREENSALNTIDAQNSLCAMALAAQIHTLILPLNLDDTFRRSCD